MKKIFLLLSLFYSYLSAEYQKVHIGFIDQRYNISFNQAEQLVLEIEKELEGQVHMNLFDYSDMGKPIDFIYIEPSQRKQDIQNSLKTLQKELKRIERSQSRLQKKKKLLLEKEKNLQKRRKGLDQKIAGLNKQIENFNQLQDNARQVEQKKIQTKKGKLEFQIDKWKQAYRNYKVALTAYNQLVVDYRFQVKRYNKLQRKLETLVRSSREVQGAAKGYKKVIYKTFSKDGITFTDKKEQNVMEKIEIYGFDSFAQLKAILAHELLHLVGVGHINVKGALMNPVLQENQVKKLLLTPEDIQNIKSSF